MRTLGERRDTIAHAVVAPNDQVMMRRIAAWMMEGQDDFCAMYSPPELVMWHEMTLPATAMPNDANAFRELTNLPMDVLSVEEAWLRDTSVTPPVEARLEVKSADDFDRTFRGLQPSATLVKPAVISLARIESGRTDFVSLAGISLKSSATESSGLGVNVVIWDAADKRSTKKITTYNKVPVLGTTPRQLLAGVGTVWYGLRQFAKTDVSVGTITLMLGDTTTVIGTLLPWEDTGGFTVLRVGPGYPDKAYTLMLKLKMRAPFMSDPWDVSMLPRLSDPIVDQYATWRALRHLRKFDDADKAKATLDALRNEYMVKNRQGEQADSYIEYLT